MDCLGQTWSREGFRGLYRGLSAPIFGAATENAALFLVYGKFQEIISYVKRGTVDTVEGSGEQKSLGELALAAAAAGAAASFLLTPIELIKVKMQVTLLATEGLLPPTSASPTLSASSPKTSSASTTLRTNPVKPDFSRLPGPFTILRQTIATKGLRGLWLGQSGTLLRETGGSSAWFTGFEVVSRAFMRRREVAEGLEKGSVTKADLKAWELCVAGGFAGMAYNVVLFPADTIKSALQTNAELRPHLANASFISTGKEIFASRGIKGLYAGCGITVARSAPSSAMIFLIYENLSRYFTLAAVLYYLVHT